MSDDIFNRLHIVGPPGEVQKVLAAIRGDKDCDGRPALIDFNRIIPMPEGLNIEYGSAMYSGQWLYRKMAEDKIEQALLHSQDQQKSNLLKRLDCAGYPHTMEGLNAYLETDEGRKLYQLGKAAWENVQMYGAPSWFQWRREHWGTVKNAYYQQQINQNTIQFCTCNNGAQKLIAALSVQFQQCSFEHTLANGDMENVFCAFTFRGGAGEVAAPFTPDAGAGQEDEECER